MSQNLSSSENKKDSYLNSLGLLALFVDVLSIIQFTSTFNFLLVGTFTWWISIAIILVFFIFGVYCIKTGGLKQQDIVIRFFGSAYFLCSILLYTFVVFSFDHSSASIKLYIGLFFLFLIPLITGYICFDRIDYRAGFRWPSYGFATANLSLICLMGYQYMVLEFPLNMEVLFRELVLAIVGSWLFLFFLDKSRKTQLRPYQRSQKVHNVSPPQAASFSGSMN